MTTAAVARPSDATTTQAEDARANINVVLSTAYRPQQHGPPPADVYSSAQPRHHNSGADKSTVRRDPAVDLIILCP